MAKYIAWKRKQGIHVTWHGDGNDIVVSALLLFVEDDFLNDQINIGHNFEHKSYVL